MSSSPVFDHLNLVVRDMEAAVRFYTALGLEVEDSEPEFQAHHRRVRLAGLSLDLDSEAFARQWDAGWPADTRPPAGVVLNLRVASRDAVDNLYRELTAAGYRGQQPPWDAFWGARYAIIEDPDGHAIGFMSPSDPAHRSPARPPGA